jgi:hypothetical protein
MPAVRFGRRVLVPMKTINDLTVKRSESLQDTQEKTADRSINTCFQNPLTRESRH